MTEIWLCATFLGGMSGRRESRSVYEREEQEKERSKEQQRDLQVSQRVERLKAFVIKVCQGIIVEISATLIKCLLISNINIGALKNKL